MKLKPPGLTCCGAMEGLAGAAGGAAAPAPKVKTPGLLFVDPNPPAPPNWKPPSGNRGKEVGQQQHAVRVRGRGHSHVPGVALEAALNTGGVKVCCPKAGAALVPAPNAGAAGGVAVNGDPNDEPNEGA